MAKLINLSTHTDNRGNLTVIEKVVSFPIKRIFYIYGVDDSVRGGHRHHTTRQMAVCIQGSCKIHCDNGAEQYEYVLDSPSKAILLECEDWHTMYDFTPDAILMVLASTEFHQEDYIFEPYQH